MLNTGDTVADFELPDETGAPRRLSTLLQDGPEPGEAGGNFITSS